MKANKDSRYLDWDSDEIIETESSESQNDQQDDNKKNNNIVSPTSHPPFSSKESSKESIQQFQIDEPVEGEAVCPINLISPSKLPTIKRSPTKHFTTNQLVEPTQKITEGL